MYPTPALAPQQVSLFPLPDARPSRPYRVPIYRVMLVREASTTLEHKPRHNYRSTSAEIN
jgi:hypothetical protein